MYWYGVRAVAIHVIILYLSDTIGVAFLFIAINMITQFLDRLTLDRETRNLQKINRAIRVLNAYMDKTILKELEDYLNKVNTTEHKDKVEIALLIIQTLQ